VADGGGRRRAVIVGGGFAGLYAARALGSAPLDLVVVDRRNHHLFQPLLYQVAGAALNPSDIAAPIRHVLRRQRNATVILAEVVAVEPGARRLRLDDGGTLDYDWLVLATGVRHSYFGRPDWERLAPGLKSVEDALEMRRRILLAFEAAEREGDAARRRAWLTFVVVGAGPTGVELAGSLSEIARHALSRDFRRIDPRQARVVLVEAGPRVLPPYPEELSARAREQLAELGVEVRTGTRVQAIDQHGVDLDGERLEARTVLWAAGVEASPLGRSLGVPLDRAGRVQVLPDLSVPGHPEVFVVGDLACFEQDGRALPGVAPVAIQQGRHVAANLRRILCGDAPLPFGYRDKGSLATIGRARAVADFGRLRLSGLGAWLAWLLIHILFLIGFRNRLLVLFEWAWVYLTWERGARLITGAGSGSSGRVTAG
jgi:NADH dehydrogenase